MNLFLWMLAGAAIGWITFAFLRWNASRGPLPCLLIGAAAGMLGGKVVAPMFTAVAEVPADFRLSAMLFAVLVAVAAMLVANFVLERWEV